MKGYKLMSDHHDHVVVAHPDGTPMKIAKHGLSLGMLGEIAKLPKHMAEGGEADDDEDVAPKKLGDAPSSGSLLESIANPIVDYLGEKPLLSRAGESIQSAMASQKEKQASSSDDSEPSPGIVQTSGAPLQSAVNDEPSQGETPPPSPQSQMPNMNEMLNAFEEEKKAAGQMSGGLGKTQLNSLQGQLDQMKDQTALQARTKALDDEGAQIEDAYKKGKVDPNKLWNEAGTTSKIGMLASIIVGGIGAGMTGGKNMGLETINGAIDKDIAAQRTGMDKQENLLKMNLQKHGNLLAAENATRLNQMSAFKGELDLAAAKQGSAEAWQRAQLMKAQINAKEAEWKYNVGKESYLWNQFQPQGGGQPNQMGGPPNPGMPLSSTFDPNKLRAGIQLGFLKGEAPTKEAAQYMLQKNQLDTIDKAFEDIEAQQTLANRLGNPRQSLEQIESTKKMYATILAKDLDGRATPQDIEANAGNFSELFDSPETKAQKKENLRNAIKMKSSYPTLISNGVIAPNDPYILSTGAAKKDVARSYKTTGNIMQTGYKP